MKQNFKFELNNLFLKIRKKGDLLPNSSEGGSELPCLLITWSCALWVPWRFKVTWASLAQSLPPRVFIPHLTQEWQCDLPARTVLQLSSPLCRPCSSPCCTTPTTGYLRLSLGLLNAATTNLFGILYHCNTLIKTYHGCSQILLSLWSLLLTQLHCLYINLFIFMTIK